MPTPRASSIAHFGSFTLDLKSGELNKHGKKIGLQEQPFRILTVMVEHPGELVTRDELRDRLWPDDTIVEFGHSINSAIKRLRDVLGDTADKPKYVETVARKGYRFAAPVERIEPQVAVAPSPEPVFNRVLATPEELPKSSDTVVRSLLVLLQLMYVAFYIGSLVHLSEIREFLSALPWPGEIFAVVAATAATLIPVRAFLVSAVLFRAPGASAKFQKLWPFLLPVDVLWSLAPFLLHHINYGLALACTTLLVYSPFAQRSLMLMLREN
jgi:cholera toxin transcriptional activator